MAGYRAERGNLGHPTRQDRATLGTSLVSHRETVLIATFATGSALS
jgi:hypothetical protein